MISLVGLASVQINNQLIIWIAQNTNTRTPKSRFIYLFSHIRYYRIPTSRLKQGDMETILSGVLVESRKIKNGGLTIYDKYRNGYSDAF